jgi:hypothetical protein
MIRQRLPFATQIVPQNEAASQLLPLLGESAKKQLMLRPDDSIFIELKKEVDSPMLESSMIKSTQPFTSRAYGGHSLSYHEASMMDAVVGNTKTLGLSRNLHDYAVTKIEDEIAIARHKRSQQRRKRELGI